MTATSEQRAEGSALLSYVYARTHHDVQARRALAVALNRPNDVNPENLAVALDANGSRSMALAVLRRMPTASLRARIAYDSRFSALRPYFFSRAVRSST
jgi:Flp pilus assembly protein TadD